jgi:DNA gyrase subunit A
LKRASAVRRGSGAEVDAGAAPEAEEVQENGDNGHADAANIELGEQRYVELSAAEQFVLTLSERGFGKRSSSFEYRTTGRGGKGIVAMSLTQKTGRIVGAFPVEEGDQIMLVTDAGKLIRTTVAGIRIAGRSTQGVIVLNTADDEHVVSVERLSEEEGE